MVGFAMDGHILCYYTIQVNLGGDIEYVQLEHLSTCWLPNGSIDLSVNILQIVQGDCLNWGLQLKCQYSPKSSLLRAWSASSVDILQIIVIEDSVSLKFPTL